MQDLQFLNPQYKLGIIPASGVFRKCHQAPEKIYSPVPEPGAGDLCLQVGRRRLSVSSFLPGLRVSRPDRGFRVQRSGSSEKIQKFHVVQQGESLGSIARMYRTYISQLIVWNNLKDAEVTPGQRIIVFGGSESGVSSPQPAEAKVYNSRPEGRTTGTTGP